MHIQISPFLLFNGNCEEAMNFYHKILGGELTMKTYGEMYEDSDNNYKGKIMHALLELEGNQIMASDTQNKQIEILGKSIALRLEYDNIEEAERVFIELSEGGQIHDSYTYTLWDTKPGLVTDKFGIEWLITI